MLELTVDGHFGSNNTVFLIHSDLEARPSDVSNRNDRIDSAKSKYNMLLLEDCFTHSV
jgi:hypothetical protein